MDNHDVPSSPGTEGDLSTNGSSESSFVGDAKGERNPTPKRQRLSDDTVQGTMTNSSRSHSNDGNATVRMILRSCTYFIYDGVSADGGHKEVARIGKVIVELLVDERYPPPRRSDMSLGRKCTEYLIAPAVSSLAWFLVKNLRTSRLARLPRSPGVQSKPASFVWANALWTVVHRVARQALIYRLFFRIGSVRYSLTSLLGIVCCFFKDSLFPDLVRLRKWPSHFSPTQGLAALFRSLVYALSFSLPVQNLSKVLKDSPRRRGNVKKLIFAIILSQLQNLRDIGKLIATGQNWTV